MSGYRFDVTCVRCGGELEHVTSGTPGTTTAAIARCHPCCIDWLVSVTLRPGIVATALPPGGGAEPAKCGTESGYRAHRRRGEMACRDCLDAKNAAKRERNRRHREEVPA